MRPPGVREIGETPGSYSIREVQVETGSVFEARVAQGGILLNESNRILMN